MGYLTGTVKMTIPHLNHAMEMSDYGELQPKPDRCREC